MSFPKSKSEDEVENLIAIMAKLPGFGPRSARRAVIKMLEKREIILEPLSKILNKVNENELNNMDQIKSFDLQNFVNKNI